MDRRDFLSLAFKGITLASLPQLVAYQATPLDVVMAPRLEWTYQPFDYGAEMGVAVTFSDGVRQGIRILNWHRLNDEQRQQTVAMARKALIEWGIEHNHV